MPNPPAVRTQHVLRCSGTADFLAALPRLVGYTAPNSVFVVLFSGKRTRAAARLDLPASDRSDQADELIDVICTVLREYDSDAPAIVISSARTFAEVGGTPWSELAARLEARLGREGLEPRELCCIAPDGWASYDDADPATARRDLSEIAETPISLEGCVMGEAVPALSTLGRIPDAEPDRQQAVSNALERIAPFPPSRPIRVAGAAFGGLAVSSATVGLPSQLQLAPFRETAAIVRELRRTDRGLSPRMTARLIRSAAHADRWFLLALGLLTRPEFAEEIAAETGVERFTAMTADPDVPGWSIGSIIGSISPDFTEHDRLPLVLQRLTRALSETPRALRPGLLALTAWVWWLSGSQSVANQQVRLALEIDPRDVLVRMVERIVSAPLLPRSIPGLRTAA